MLIKLVDRLGSRLNSESLQLVIVTIGTAILTFCPLHLPNSKRMIVPSLIPQLPSPVAVAVKQDAAVAEVMRRIILKESAGDPAVINPDSGALGLGQVMPENLPDWSWEAISREVSVQEFLGHPELQKQIIYFKLNQYWRLAVVKTLDPITACRRVASTWYSGNPNRYDDTVPQGFNGGIYPSIADYTASVCAGFESSIKTF